jgi:hypothetical protein
MTRRVYTVWVALAGVICVYVAIRSFFFVPIRPVRTDVVQGVLVGFGLAIVAAQMTATITTPRVNGWTASLGCGGPDRGMLRRAACALAFPGPINAPQEAMYWTTSVDGARHALSGEQNYVMHFPPGGLPPNEAFWSLTMGDGRNRFVANPIDRYSVSDRTGLVPNADGSVDIFIQKTEPAGHESNWLPAPSGRFVLWLRVYMPGPAILDGRYAVPPIMAAH